jgi:hypothetical protein
LYPGRREGLDRVPEQAPPGLVEAGQRGRRDSRPFAISGSGRAAFEEWLVARPGEETIRFRCC